MQRTADSSEVDVVVLSWNRLKETLEAVESVLSQEEVELRLIVVDQGSESSTVEALRGRASVSGGIMEVIALNRNVGVPAGRNIGARTGTSPVIVNLDNDAELRDPTALRYVVDRFASEDSLAVMSFRIKQFATGQDDELSWVYPASLRETRGQEFTATRFSGGGHAVRREAFEACGGYDESLFFYWEEVDLSDRIIRAGYRIIYDPRVEVFHKVTSDQRVEWGGGRYFYLVRNAVFLSYRRDRRLRTTMGVALGYLAKGVYNHLPRAALTGVFAGLAHILRAREPRPGSAGRAVFRAYMAEHEMKYRGNIATRLRNEVFVRLPGHSP